MKSFDTLDTSHWRTADKGWAQQRLQHWLEIEKLLVLLHKGKKARAIIKRYFLKGLLPDWKALADWNCSNGARHLDLMLLLYLHPSTDDAVLRPLRDQFMNNPDARIEDRLIGFLNMRSLALCACSGGTRMAWMWELEKELPSHVIDNIPFAAGHTDKKRIVMHTDGQNERLIQLMWPDTAKRTALLPITQATQHFVRLRGRTGVEELPLLPVMHELANLYLMGDWLALPSDLNAGARDMLYQHQHALDIWYHQCADETVSRTAAHRELLLIAVYRIYRFDTHAEGEDSPRTRFVQRIKSMFEQRAFTASFKALLAVVRDGEAVVHDAWGFEPKVLVPALYTHDR